VLILERRDRIGGTWDLFRYPGVRSDSDMANFSYPFRPWTRPERFVSGEHIRDYIAATAAEANIEDAITYGSHVEAASWSRAANTWTLETRTAQGERRFTCRFLYLCTGYFDYDHSYEPDFAGRGDFDGVLLAPQFWPAKLDCAGRDVAIIGSGATAVPLAPALARAGVRVTMLQRSPSYVTSLPSRATSGGRRALSILGQHAFNEYSRRRPDRAAALLCGAAAREVGWPMVEEHFNPPYRPWTSVCAWRRTVIFSGRSRRGPSPCGRRSSIWRRSRRSPSSPRLWLPSVRPPCW
jgi:monooxygenase